MLPLGVIAQQGGGGPIEFVASNFVYPNVTNPVVNIPVGTVDGDLMLITGNSRNSYVSAVSGGWTPMWRWGIGSSGGFSAPGGSANEETFAWYRFADSEPASYTFTTSSNGNSFGISTFRNAKSVEAFSEQPNTHICPTMDALTGDWLLGLHGTSYDTERPTVPAGMTEIGFVHNASYRVGTLLGYEILLADGFTGTRTFVTPWSGYTCTAGIILRP